MRYGLDDLRLFVHIVAEGSITAGAQRMHLSLPSASARVRALEQQAGVALLIRERRGVRTTPAGTTLARHARDVLDQTTRLESAVASYVRTPQDPLIVLGGGSAMHRLIPRALLSFLRTHPSIDVVATESRTALTEQRLADSEADLGIVLDDEAGRHGLRMESLGEDPLVVIGEAGGVLAGIDGITYREAAEHPFIGLDPESSLRRWTERHLGPRAPIVRHRTTVTDLGTLIALVAAGAGLAVVPRRAIDPRHELEICELRERWAAREHFLAWGVTDRARSPETEALAAHIHNAARGDGAG